MILDPQATFYGENVSPDVEVDCGGKIIAPGYLELQINGKMSYLILFADWSIT